MGANGDVAVEMPQGYPFNGPGRREDC
jgi:hypothetical protein